MILTSIINIHHQFTKYKTTIPDIIQFISVDKSSNNLELIILNFNTENVSINLRFALNEKSTVTNINFVKNYIPERTIQLKFKLYFRPATIIKHSSKTNILH